MKIVVLAGGLSPERDVSLSSGAKITMALAEKGHEVVLIDSFLGIEEPEEGLSSLFKTKDTLKMEAVDVPWNPPDLQKVWADRVPDTGCFVGQNVVNICRLADVVFIALHGKGGEDGQMQAFFDTLRIPYTGSKFYGCAFAMNKDVSKHLMKANRVPTARWEHVADWENPHWDRIAELGFPLVVKPNCGGSSIGTYIVKDQKELEQALKDAAKVDTDLIVEEYIGGREFCVGILDGKALPPVEIIPIEGFFDYQKKYQPGLTQEICPARISTDELMRMQDAALTVHYAIGLGYYSRVDFKMLPDGSVFCLEANTLPGMTPGSLLPKEATAAGIAYADLCDQIVRHPVQIKQGTLG